MKSHSKQFIAAMKVLLEAEKAKLEEELAGTMDFPEYGRDEEANAMEIADSTALRSSKEARAARLREIQAALDRIIQGTYGVTSEEKLIPEDRLRANPAATGRAT